MEYKQLLPQKLVFFVQLDYICPSSAFFIRVSTVHINNINNILYVGMWEYKRVCSITNEYLCLILQMLEAKHITYNTSI